MFYTLFSRTRVMQVRRREYVTTAGSPYADFGMKMVYGHQQGSKASDPCKIILLICFLPLCSCSQCAFWKHICHSIPVTVLRNASFIELNIYCGNYVSRNVFKAPSNSGSRQSRWQRAPRIRGVKPSLADFCF